MALMHKQADGCDGFVDDDHIGILMIMATRKITVVTFCFMSGSHVLARRIYRDMSEDLLFFLFWGRGGCIYACKAMLGPGDTYDTNCGGRRGHIRPRDRRNDIFAGTFLWGQVAGECSELRLDVYGPGGI